MDEWQMQHRLWCYFGTSWDIGVPNAFVWSWESDVVALSKRGYLTEYEIKVTVADLKRDHKKKKHWFMKNGHDGPSRFYYVVPAEIQDKIKYDQVYNDVPVYAGLIVVHPWHCSIVKRAPRIHNKPATERQVNSIRRSLYHKAWDARNTVVRLLTEKRMQNGED